MSNAPPPNFQRLALLAMLGGLGGVSLSPRELLDATPLRDYYRPVPRGTYRTRRKPCGPRKRLQRPPCEPGTITFHDRLVRKYGRRVADEIGRRFRRGDKNAIPKFKGGPA